jgi:hypothetical protein
MTTRPSGLSTPIDEPMTPSRTSRVSKKTDPKSPSLRTLSSSVENMR